VMYITDRGRSPAAHAKMLFLLVLALQLLWPSALRQG
jgi:hypothetical protein